MAFKYLSKEVLGGFDKYKYNSIDNSPFSNYIIHPFWNWVVEFYPTWIAPNALTLSGFLFLVLQFGILTYYDPAFYASADNFPDSPRVPQWVWIACAFCTFASHTLDGTDGKQARRTKTSGPLGELFDHGLDSWATFLMPMAMYSAFGRGDYSLDVDRVFYIFVAIQLAFTISHWEKYNTGVLFLPWGYDLSQVGMMLLYIYAYFWGTAYFKFNVPVLNITSGQLFEIIMHMGVISFSLPMSLYNVYVAYRDKTGKNLSFYESIRPLIPPIIVFTLFVIWAQTSQVDILKREPRLFYIVSGTVYSNTACRLIVNGMSNTRCEAFNILLVPLIAIVWGVMTLRLGVMEIYLLWAYTIFVMAAHLHYGICVPTASVLCVVILLRLANLNVVGETTCRSL